MATSTKETPYAAMIPPICAGRNLVSRIGLAEAREGHRSTEVKRARDDDDGRGRVPKSMMETGLALMKAIAAWRSLDTTLGFSRALFSLSKLPQSPPSYHLVAARALGGASEVPGTPARARDPRLMRWSHSPPPKKTPVPQRARVQRPSPCTAKYPLLVHVPLLPGLFSAYTPPKEF